MAYVTKVSGPPGTGKTTTIVKQIQNALNAGIQPEEIAFVSLTNKSINTAIDRVKENLSEEIAKRCTAFRTLHSFTTSFGSNMHGKSICSIEDYNEKLLPFLQSRGFLKAKNKIAWEGDPHTQREWALEALQWHKTVEQPLNDGICDYIENVKGWENTTQSYTLQLKQLIDAWKVMNGMVEFEDVIEDFNNFGHEECPQFKVIFIDEAQDLTPAQWTTIERLKSKCEYMYIYGDINQSIYAFAGVDMDRYLSFPADDHKTLNKTWRFGDKIRNFALNKLGEHNAEPEAKYKGNNKRSFVCGSKRMSTIVKAAIAANKTIYSIAPSRKNIINITNFLNDEELQKAKDNDLIKMTTVHKQKGGQADVVIYNNYFSKGWQRTPDSEIARIRYVARTRAKRIHLEVCIQN